MGVACSSSSTLASRWTWQCSRKASREQKGCWQGMQWYSLCLRAPGPLHTSMSWLHTQQHLRRTDAWWSSACSRSDALWENTSAHDGQGNSPSSSSSSRPCSLLGLPGPLPPGLRPLGLRPLRLPSPSGGSLQGPGFLSASLGLSWAWLLCCLA